MKGDSAVKITYIGHATLLIEMGDVRHDGEAGDHPPPRNATDAVPSGAGDSTPVVADGFRPGCVPSRLEWIASGNARHSEQTTCRRGVLQIGGMV